MYSLPLKQDRTINAATVTFTFTFTFLYLCFLIIYSLPLKQDRTINDRYMPVLANGHIGVTVYNDSLFLNGLYSGAGGRYLRQALRSLYRLEKFKRNRPECIMSFLYT